MHLFPILRVISICYNFLQICKYLPNTYNFLSDDGSLGLWKGTKTSGGATMEEEEILVPIIILSLYAREFPALFRKWDQKQNGKTLLEAICTNHQRIGFFAEFLKVNILANPANQYSTLQKFWNFSTTMIFTWNQFWFDWNRKDYHFNNIKGS